MRNLTTEEHNILAHVVIDPAGWWSHCQSIEKIDSEKALAEKTATHKQSYDESKVLVGYKTRAERETELAQI